MAEQGRRGKTEPLGRIGKDGKAEKKDAWKSGTENRGEGRNAKADSRRSRPEKRDAWKENRGRQGSRENWEENKSGYRKGRDARQEHRGEREEGTYRQQERERRRQEGNYRWEESQGGRKEGNYRWEESEGGRKGGTYRREESERGRKGGTYRREESERGRKEGTYRWEESERGQREGTYRREEKEGNRKGRTYQREENKGGRRGGTYQREETGREKGETKRGSRPGVREAGHGSGKQADMPSQKQRARKICHAFGDCGGCQLLGIPYEEQLAEKKRKLAKLLKPYVKLEGMIGMEEPEHYRNKVNAAFTHDRNGKPLSGVYKEGTHYIIPIEQCALENRKADEIIGSVRKLLPSFRIKTYDEDADYGLLRHVMVRIGHATGQIMVVLVLASPMMPSKNNFAKALVKLHPEITTIVVNVNDRKTSMVLGDKEQVIYGKGYIEDVLCGLTYKISPKSFYQVNSVQAEKLYAKAMEYAGLSGKETVLDAYCGIGPIGMTAAKKAKRVIGVELNQDAVQDAVANARMNKIGNIQFYQKDAGEFMMQVAEQEERIDVVFMDPPRTGSDEVFLDALATLKPKKVVYISCNPETLVRDLDVLVKRGYRVMRGMGCDMFPFCGHVETVTLLVRKP